MKELKNTLILTIITVVAGLALGVVYEITKEPIAAAEAQAKIVAWQEVFPDAAIEDFEPVEVDQKAAESAIAEQGVNGTIDEVAQVGDMGYAITSTNKDGFGGNIQITVGINNDGSVNGISILSISETAGLGMNAQNPDFYNQYVGKQTESFYVSKDGGNGEPIDALSGATITSRSFTGAVNGALGYFKQIAGGSQ